MIYTDRHNNARILQHLDRLTSDGGSFNKKEIGSYHCPICDSKNFKIMHDGRFLQQCGCSSSDIWKAIVPFEPQTRAERWQKPKLGSSQPNRSWTYTDASGNPVVMVSRRDSVKSNGIPDRKFSQSH